MAEWQSPDGGSITRLGNSSFVKTSVSLQVVVSAAANTNGVIIASAVGAGNSAIIKAGALAIVRTLSSTFAMAVKDVFVPAGVEISAELTGPGFIDISYTIL